VITVLSGIPDYAALPEFARWQHERWGNPRRVVELRRAEDRTALERLGVADVVYLDDQFDAIYRVGTDGQSLYNSDPDIFGDLDPMEAKLPAAIADELEPLLFGQDEGWVFVPLAVGRHVDHVLVHAAGRELAERGYAVAYYEEYPYVNWPGSLDAALAGKQDWVPEPSPLDEAAMVAKIAAVSYYRSQNTILFGDDLAMSRLLRRHAAAIAPPGSAYAERYWLCAQVSS
jgi:LmbE family N-acetylglucosaminyl deacetylase